MVYLGKVVCEIRTGENVVSILPICEVILRKICARYNDLVINTVQLHVLQTPPFVETVWDNLFTQASEVWGMVHSDFDALAEFGNQWG